MTEISQKMSKTEAFNRIMDYVQVARDAVKNQQGNKVIRLTTTGGVRSVGICDTDSIKSKSYFWRSGENKHENNVTRNDFRDCILTFCGKQKLSNLSGELKDALEISNFSHTGKPLSASRILKAFDKFIEEAPFKIGSDVKRKNQVKEAEDYRKLMLDPQYRKECAQRAETRGDLKELLIKAPVDLETDKCVASHIDKLCTITGDMGDSVLKLEGLGFPREFLLAVNYADGSCFAGGILHWDTQEETLIRKMNPDLMALLIEKGIVEIKYEEKYDKMAFAFTKPLTKDALSPASDPYLLKFQRNDGKVENVVNLAMPSLNHTRTGFDNNNFSERILDVKKREIGAAFDTKQHVDKESLKNWNENDRKNYLIERNQHIDSEINLLIGNTDRGNNRRTNLLNYAQNFYELINAEKEAYLNSKDEPPVSPLGLSSADDTKELMKIVQFAGEGLDVNPFDTNSKEQAEKAFTKALVIHRVHQKAVSKPDELTEDEQKLEKTYQKANQNYEDNIYEEISRAIIQARKAGMKAFPIGPMGCGAFANDPSIIGKLAARAFLEYGGDMLPMVNYYDPMSTNDSNGKLVLMAMVDAFNAELEQRGLKPFLDVNDLLNEDRLAEVAKKFKEANPDINVNDGVQQPGVPGQNYHLIEGEEDDNGEFELVRVRPQRNNVNTVDQENNVETESLLQEKESNEVKDKQQENKVETESLQNEKDESNETNKESFLTKIKSNFMMAAIDVKDDIHIMVDNKNVSKDDKVKQLKEYLTQLVTDVFINRINQLKPEDQDRKDVKQFSSHIDEQINRLDEIVKNLVEGNNVKKCLSQLCDRLRMCHTFLLLAPKVINPDQKEERQILLFANEINK